MAEKKRIKNSTSPATLIHSMLPFPPPPSKSKSIVVISPSHSPSFLSLFPPQYSPSYPPPSPSFLSSFPPPYSPSYPPRPCRRALVFTFPVSLHFRRHIRLRILSAVTRIRRHTRLRILRVLAVALCSSALFPPFRNLSFTPLPHRLHWNESLPYKA